MWRAPVALSMNDSERARMSGEEPKKLAPALTRAVATAPSDFSALFTDHAPHVWRAVRGLGVREADIEDICQEVFVIVHRKLAGFEGRSSLRTWIYGIALRVVADHRKRAYRTREQLVDTLPDYGLAASQEQHTAERQAWRMLQTLLAGLSEDQRQVFVLYELEQLPMREIAALLGCPLQTAYSRLEAARELVQRRSAALRERESAP